MYEVVHTGMTPPTLLLPISSSLVVSTPIHHSTLFSIICKKPTPNPQFYSSKDSSCSFAPIQCIIFECEIEQICYHLI
jgi:hypothetical protein